MLPYRVELVLASFALPLHAHHVIWHNLCDKEGCLEFERVYDTFHSVFFWSCID